MSNNDTVTDEFQISRSGTTNVFYVYFNGSRVTTSNVQFWNSRRIAMGAEIATPDGESNMFNMTGRAITQSGTRVDLPTPQVEDVENQDQLWGNSPGNSRWNWRIRE